MPYFHSLELVCLSLLEVKALRGHSQTTLTAMGEGLGNVNGSQLGGRGDGNVNVDREFCEHSCKKIGETCKFLNPSPMAVNVVCE